MRDFVTKNSKAMGRAIRAFSKRAVKSFGSVFKKLTSLKSLFAGFFLVLAAKRAFGALTKTADEIDRIIKSSDRLNITTDSLQRMRFVAEISGTTFESLAKGVATLQKNLDSARQGLTEQARAFDIVGLSMENLPLGPGGKIDVIELLAQVADGMAAIEDPATRTALAMNLFGRAGKELGPVFAGGREEIEKLANEAERFGGIIGIKGLQRAADFNDSMTRLETAVRGVRFELFTELAPKLAGFFEHLAGIIADNRDQIIDFFKSLGREFLNVLSLMTQGFVEFVKGFEGVFGVLTDTNKLKESLAAINEELRTSANVFQLVKQERDRLVSGGATRREATKAVNVGNILTAEGPLGDEARARSERRARLLEQIKTVTVAMEQGLGAALERSFMKFKRQVQQFETKGGGVGTTARTTPSQEIEKVEAALAKIGKRRELLQLQQQLLDIVEPTKEIELKFAEIDAQLRELPLAEAFVRGEISVVTFNDALERMNLELDKTKERVKGNFLQGFVDGAKRASEAFFDMTAAGEQAAQTLIGGGLNRLTDGFTQVILGSKSAKEALKEFAASFLADLVRIIVQLTIVKALGGAFGFGGSVGLAQGGVFTGAVKHVESFAKGGVASRPTMALFGEAGAEAFVPLAGGKIPVELKGQAAGQFVFAPVVNAVDAASVRDLFVRERGTLMAIWRNGLENVRSLREAVRDT